MHTRQRFQNNYDFLRMFAALCITFFHSFALLDRQQEAPLETLTGGRISASFVALSIFFSISGYLIAKSASTSPTTLNYLWKRLLRIQPLLLVVCFLTVFLLGPLFTSLPLTRYFTSLDTWTYFRNVLPVFGIQFTLPGVFSHNIADRGVNGSLWTLIVEERMYLIMCIIFLFKKQNARYLVLYILFVNVVYLFNLFYFLGEMIPSMAGLPFYYALIFLNSAALFIGKVDFAKNSSRWVIFGGSLTLLAFASPVLRFFTLISFPIFVNSVAQIKGKLNNAGKFGDFTYGIYVFSFPVQQMLISGKTIINSPYILFFISSAIVIPLAVVSWHFIESPFLALKKYVK